MSRDPAPPTPKTPRYVFGPVPSRRLGRSLGVDLSPAKTCTFDCVYCQLGRTSVQTAERAAYVPVGAVLDELRGTLRTGPRPDFVTLSGSGEPTLHSELDVVIRGIRRLTDAPVAVITSGALLYQPEVRTACGMADVVLPTLAAADEATYQRVHRPCAGLTLETHVAGIAALSREEIARVWLELFLIEGVNTGRESRAGMIRLIQRIQPHRVQINTAVRPPCDSQARAADEDLLSDWAREIGPTAEVVAERTFRAVCGPRAGANDIEALCRRHACTITQLVEVLGLPRPVARRYLAELIRAGTIERVRRGGAPFYLAPLTAQRPNGCAP